MDLKHSSVAPPPTIRRGGGELPPPSYEVAAKYSPKVRAHRAGSELEHSSRHSTPVSATGGGFPTVIGSDEYPHTTTSLADQNDLRPRTNSNMKISFAPGTNGAVMGRSAGGGGGGSAGGGDVSLSEVTDLLDNDDWVSQSNNGGGGGASVENLNSDHYTRLIRFYERYNPEKIERAYEFLKAYKGDEEELFRLLTEKYGPEPERPQPPPDADGKGSEAGSMFHFVGPRVKLPERVSANDGRTEMVTPYWPAFRTLGDRDILDLFLSKRTDNKELKKCYIGYMDGHPQHAWNGMTYLSAAPLPKDPNTLFLGHTWSGTLANNKTLIYRTGTFRRVVLHCTDDCQARELPKVKPKQPVPPPPSGTTTTAPLPLPSDSRGSTTVDEGSPMSSLGSSGGILTQRPSNHSRQPSFDPLVPSPTVVSAKSSDYVIAPSPQDAAGPFSLDGNSALPPESCGSPHRHGRWRLAIYHSDHLEHVLYRVMYDPDLVAMMWDGGNSSRGADGGSGGMGQASSSKGSHTDPASHSLTGDPRINSNINAQPNNNAGMGGRKHGSSISTNPRSASPTDVPSEKRSFFSSLFSKKKKEDMLSESEGRGVGGPSGPTPQAAARGGRPSSSTRPTSAPREDDQYSISTGSSIRPRGASPNRPYSRSGVRVLGYTEPQQPVRQPSPMPRPPQPQQPTSAAPSSILPPPITSNNNAASEPTDATLAQFTQLLNGLESRMVVRLDALEARLSSLESRHQR